MSSTAGTTAHTTDEPSFLAGRGAFSFGPETGESRTVAGWLADDPSRLSVFRVVSTVVEAELWIGAGLEIVAPFGLGDPISLRLRPTPAFAGAKRHVFEERIRDERWLERWPPLTIID